ncbi:DUF1616 domain-containing protein [Halosimplex amylolyticum]|uniref:DUF1616 domain-containing protein n=1 Tax=Halosimplex amylolyticum TaxID=3396616 RepID=UPI003F552B24
MSTNVGNRILRPIRRSIREIPVDIGAVLVLVALGDLSLLLPSVTDVPVRLAFELLLVVFLPGYAVVAALFPRSSGRSATEDAERDATFDRRIEPTERFGLSFGLSLALVLLIGLVLTYTPWGLRRLPIIVSVSGFSAVAAIVAAVRRAQVPEEERFTVDVRSRIARLHNGFLDRSSPLDTTLNVFLSVGLLLALCSVGYVFMIPTEGQQNTEFYVLTENESGELVVSDYPQDFNVGETSPVTLRIQNDESKVQEYTIVASLQKIRHTNGTTTVTESRELERIHTTPVERGGTWTREYDIEPTMAGDQMRVAFFLYRGEAPRDPTVKSAYRELRLQVNVSS